MSNITKEHNDAELDDIQQIYINEKWHLGVELGRDPECLMSDIEAVWNRVTDILLEGGFGEKMSRRLHGGVDPAHE